MDNGGKENFVFNGSTTSTATTSKAPAVQPEVASPLVQWQASEFVDHQKSASWFIPLIAAIFLASCVIYLLTRDILATLVVALGGVAFGVYARQSPRTLTYSLMPTSLKIGDKSYSYDDFRTFSILQEGALFSILLQPVRRLMPPITIYFDPEDGEKIFDTLAAHLPHQEQEQDLVERMMRKIRF